MFRTDPIAFSLYFPPTQTSYFKHSVLLVKADFAPRLFLHVTVCQTLAYSLLRLWEILVTASKNLKILMTSLSKCMSLDVAILKFSNVLPFKTFFKGLNITCTALYIYEPISISCCNKIFFSFTTPKR